MNKIIFTIGIPASGKSTWKDKFMSENSEFVSIERDDIRMKFFGVEMCSPKDEQLVSKISDEIAFIALSNKKSIIFSNTNLNLKFLKLEISKWSKYADIEFVVFDISLEESLLRNSLRDRKVPVEIIERMYKSYLDIKKNFDFLSISKTNYTPAIKQTFSSELDDAYIFDLDGTLAFIDYTSKETSRTWYDYDKVENDLVETSVFEIMRALKNSGFKIIFLTGRFENCRKETENWIINKLKIKNPILYMKPNEFETDVKFKKSIYLNEISKKWNIMGVFEDRQKVVDMWREIGLKTFQVEKTI